MITYTYKAKLNAHTHRNLAEFLTQQRLLYNGALQERIDCYQKTGVSIGLFDQRGSLTTIRHTDEWFGKFDRWCQDSALVRVDRAFKRFFREGRGFPRFKSAKRGVMSFETLHKKPTFNGKYGYVKIKGIGRFRWRQDTRCDARDHVKVVRVVQRPTGIFIQLVCDHEIRRLGLNRAIGIDVGVRVSAALSDGTVIPRHTPDRTDIRRKQRALSRSEPGSNQRKKRRQTLARACYRARVRRHNAIHRLTSEIVKDHGKWIAVEDLDIQAMTASAAGTVRLSRTSGPTENRFESLDSRAELGHVHHPTGLQGCKCRWSVGACRPQTHHPTLCGLRWFTRQAIDAERSLVSLHPLRVS